MRLIELEAGEWKTSLEFLQSLAAISLPVLPYKPDKATRVGSLLVDG